MISSQTIETWSGQSKIKNAECHIKCLKPAFLRHVFSGIMKEIRVLVLILAISDVRGRCTVPDHWSVARPIAIAFAEERVWASEFETPDSQICIAFQTHSSVWENSQNCERIGSHNHSCRNTVERTTRCVLSLSRLPVRHRTSGAALFTS